MTRMKESGIDWIGQIPEEWEVVRLQDVGDYKKGPFGSAITIDMFIEKSPGSYKVYEQKNAIRGNCEIGEAYIPKSVYNNLKNFSVYPLDIIVSCAGTIGKCYILPEDCEQGIINQALMRVRVNKSFNLEYFLYIFDIVLSYAAIKYSNGSAIKNIPPFNVLNKLRVTLPSNIEQLQIVNYLDKKTALLDKAKALLEEQIQKLKDYRASLIYETVTKGLDQTVPMKDSGIDWIGQVPEEWDISKIKFTTQLNGRIGWQGLTSAEYKEEGPYLITGTDFHNGTINFETAVHIDEKRWSEASQIQVENGDLLITKDGTVGKVAIISGLDDKASLNSGVLRIQTIDEIDRRFLYYVLLSDEFWMWFNYTNSGASTILHLYQNVFDEFTFTFPQKNEQTKISDLLDKKTYQIDQLIQIKNQQIENINKQRQTLIYDYVTGKRRV